MNRRSANTPPLPAEAFFLALNGCQNLAARLGEEALKPLRLTVSEYTLLRILERTPGVTAAEVRVRSRATAPAVGQLVSALERKRYLSRTTDPKDARRQPLLLTTLGRRKATAASAAVRQAVGQLLLPAAELQRLAGDLEGVHALLLQHPLL